MDSEQTTSTLPYATPQAKQLAPLRRLPTSLAIATVICGTALVTAPSVAVCVLHGQFLYGIPDYIMALLWATGGVGLAIVLLGIFMAAPAARKPRRAC